MAASETAICNSALNKVGVPSIDSINDENPRARACKQQYPLVRDHLLRSYFWNFSGKRIILALDTFTIVPADVTAGTDIINKVGHGRVTGDRFTLETNNVLPSPLLINTDYFIIRINDDDFKLALTHADSVAGTVIDLTDGGTGIHTLESRPAFEWDKKYLLPSDYLRSEKMQHHEDFEVEAGYILSNVTDPNFKYIMKVTNTLLFDPAFDELLALMLAHEIAYKLTQSNTTKETLGNELQLILRDVRSMDAQEGTPDQFEVNTWTNARL